MRLLALDIGSSSVKAAILRNDGPPRGIVRVSFPTIYNDDGVAPRAEVKLAAIERALRGAIAALGPAAKRVDLIAAATMSPSWLALDAGGKPLTNVITHQDRRSVVEAAAIERRVGKAEHLALAGNRPFPGGISSTTIAWHLAHQRPSIDWAAMVGHLGTWFAHALTGARVIDLSNAGFTGLMDIQTRTWSDRLIEAAGVDREQLPEIVESNAIVGVITSAAARRWGLAAGTPLLAGCIDGSAAMLAAGGINGAKVGQIVNVCGSTDVLAVCASAPLPHEELLTRPLGVGGKWLSVATIAAAGSAVEWAHATFFCDLSKPAFFRHVDRLARGDLTSRARFDGSLAGSRTAMDVRSGRIEGLTLSTDRDDVLRALLSDLAHQACVRFDRFADAGVRLGKDILVTGGGSTLSKTLLRGGWPRGMRTRTLNEATLRGLWQLANG
jgi:xylulokinase